MTPRAATPHFAARSTIEKVSERIFWAVAASPVKAWRMVRIWLRRRVFRMRLTAVFRSVIRTRLIAEKVLAIYCKSCPCKDIQFSS